MPTDRLCLKRKAVGSRYTYKCIVSVLILRIIFTLSIKVSCVNHLRRRILWAKGVPFPNSLKLSPKTNIQLDGCRSIEVAKAQSQSALRRFDCFRSITVHSAENQYLATEGFGMLQRIPGSFRKRSCNGPVAPRRLVQATVLQETRTRRWLGQPVAEENQRKRSPGTLIRL